MPLRSAPAEKAFSPAPVMTTTRTMGSALAWATFSRMPSTTAQEIELRRLGRLIVTVATPAATSYRTSSSAIRSDHLLLLPSGPSPPLRRPMAGRRVGRR